MGSGVPIHWTYDSYLRAQRPRHFRRPAGLKPVSGGRWSIRKYHVREGQKAWRAWTERGTRANRWSRRFHTQAEAFAWAAFVSGIYADRTIPPSLKDQVIRGRVQDQRAAERR
ncbi:MAG: hypothetical protein K0S70_82 [Microbacterium sp.]|jgi:hypothetical protein|nr:hypothetical protein [Microbacterium sp.]